MKYFLIFFLLITTLGYSPVFGAKAEDYGKISGKIVDKNSGDNLIGVNVYVVGTKRGAISDMDGNFLIKNLESGTYDLRAQMVGYNPVTVTGVEVKADELVAVDFSMESTMQRVEDIVVTAKALENIDVTVMAHRQAAEAVSDAVSGEEISRSGSSNAADAVKKVVGATVVDGKYVYVRGLGDRYTTTNLNGMALPSPSPEQQSMPLDLIPAGMLDNVVVLKTFTPDKPGNFSGGMVDVNTQKIPETFTMKFSSSVGYNKQSTGNDILTYAGGKRDWLGMDDGTRDIPAPAVDPNAENPGPGTARNSYKDAQIVNNYTRSFSNQWAPTIKTGPLNQSYSFAVANRFNVFDKPLGASLNLSYSRKVNAYDDGTENKWALTGDVNSKVDLTPQNTLTDAQTKETVLWGVLGTLSYQIHNNHRLNFTYMRTQQGEDEARSLSGLSQERFGYSTDPTRETIWRTRVLHYTESKLSSADLAGEHLLGKVKVEWHNSYKVTEQNEPDLRYFSDHFRTRPSSGVIDTIYGIQINQYREPYHYFRFLDESNRAGKLDMTIPFKQWFGFSSKFKLGGAYLRKNRDFQERAFEVQGIWGDYRLYDGNYDAFFSDENSGYGFEFDTTSTDPLVVDTNIISLDGGRVVEHPNSQSHYHGFQKVDAGYLMVDLPLTKWWSFIGGARYEKTVMNVYPYLAPTYQQIVNNIEDDDWLPSLNFVFRIKDNINFRSAYTRTLSRPTMREIAPYHEYPVAGGYGKTGNPDLKITKIKNYDLRLEYFERPGEVYAVSVFWRELENPVDWVQYAVNDEIGPVNVPKAKVRGVEFEVRKRLDQLTHYLNHFQVGLNLTLVHSEMAIFAFEDNAFQGVGIYGYTRPLLGQSPYIVNADITYNNLRRGTQVSLFYNVFGKRYRVNALDVTPDIYEQPRHILDATLSQRLFTGVKLKLGAKNILNDPITFSQEYKGREFIQHQHWSGVTFSIGVAYSFE